MPGPKALHIELTDAEREHLEKTVRKQTAPQRQVRRSHIVLLAADGLANAAIARQLRCSRYTVWKWRKRFAKERVAGLQSRPRPGRPRSFPPLSSAIMWSLWPAAILLTPACPSAAGRSALWVK